MKSYDYSALYRRLMDAAIRNGESREKADPIIRRYIRARREMSRYK